MSTDVTVVDRLPAIQPAKKDPLDDAPPEWKQVVREAEKLAVATLTPVHLKVVMPPFRENDPKNDAARRAAWNQTVANCILVANQALKWKADVFAVAAESYVVANKLGYQGKLIAAVVNARGGLTTPLRAVHSKTKGDNFSAVVYGSKTVDLQSLSKEEKKEIFALLVRYADDDDQEANRDLAMADILAVRVSVGQCKTFDKQGEVNKQWTKDPEQKLVYTGTTKWARRYTPELMVGILSDDDLDRMKAEQRVDQTAEQRRISALIPASLDTTTFGVPADSPEFRPETEATLTTATEPGKEAEKASEPNRTREPGEDDEPPFNPPNQAEQAAARAQLEAEECLTAWGEQIAACEDVTACNKLERESLPSAPQNLRSRILEMILARRTAIRGKRGK